MYSKVVPVYDREKKDKEKEEIINADDPSNKNKVREILFGQ